MAQGGIWKNVALKKCSFLSPMRIIRIIKTAKLLMTTYRCTNWCWPETFLIEAPEIKSERNLTNLVQIVVLCVETSCSLLVLGYQRSEQIYCRHIGIYVVITCMATAWTITAMNITNLILHIFISIFLTQHLQESAAYIYTCIISSMLAQVLMLLICIRWVHGSNLGRDIDYRDWAIW